MTMRITPARFLAALVGLAVVIGGCGAAAHLQALQPPSVKTTTAIVLPAVNQPVAATRPAAPRFQAGIDIDWYHYQGQQIGADALATAAYMQSLHANSVSISFPFFMAGQRSGSVHGTVATPTPGQLATAIGTFKQVGFYVSLRPLLDEKSLGRGRVGWIPVSQSAWFRSYQRFLKPYAKMAARTRVNEILIGTELTGFSLSPKWGKLARSLRTWYHGTLACADNWTRIVVKGCDVALQTADAYHPARNTTNFLAAWEKWDRTLAHGMPETEVGIAAAQGAQNKPWVLNWPVRQTDPQLQARWFTAACQAAIATHLGGIYFWSIGLTQTNPVGPTLASQTTWTGGPGARAIARCFASIGRARK